MHACYQIQVGAFDLPLARGPGSECDGPSQGVHRPKGEGVAQGNGSGSIVVNGPLSPNVRCNQERAIWPLCAVVLVCSAACAPIRVKADPGPLEFRALGAAQVVTGTTWLLTPVRFEPRPGSLAGDHLVVTRGQPGQPRISTPAVSADLRFVLLSSGARVRLVDLHDPPSISDASFISFSHLRLDASCADISSAVLAVGESSGRFRAFTWRTLRMIVELAPEAGTISSVKIFQDDTFVLVRVRGSNSEVMRVSPRRVETVGQCANGSIITVNQATGQAFIGQPDGLVGAMEEGRFRPSFRLSSAVIALSSVRGGRLLAACADGSVRLLDFEAVEEVLAFHVDVASVGRVASLGLSSSGKVALVYSSSGVIVAVEFIQRL